MKIYLNGYTYESDTPDEAIAAAIRSFGDNPELEAIREWAIKTVNDIDTEAAESSGTITGTLSMVLRYTDNALRVKIWNDLGRPDPPDQFLFKTAYDEGAQFNPPYSAAEMLEVWEQAWTQMSSEPGRPLRRWALEAIKTAESVEVITGILAQYASAIAQYI